jgi:hypothetical protein
MSVALKQGILRFVGEESVTVDATSGGVAFTTGEITTRVVMASCRLETAQIRISGGGTVPTAGGTEGSPLVEIGEMFEVWGQADLASFRAIRTGSTSGALRVQYFGTAV